MKTFQAPAGTIFHHNSDFSGDVIIETAEGNEVRVSADDILAFVAKSYVLPAKIERLEDVGADVETRIQSLQKADAKLLLCGLPAIL